MATIECGETAEVNFVIKDLDLESEYFYDISYSSEGNVAFFNIPEDVNTYFTMNGDVNVDGNIDNQDINAIVEYILKGEYNEKADLNNDNKVNAADLVKMIDTVGNP